MNERLAEGKAMDAEGQSLMPRLNDALRALRGISRLRAAGHQAG